MLQAAVTGLPPRQPFVLALAGNRDATSDVTPLASLMTNPAGAAIVNAVGPIRQVVEAMGDAPRRFLVVTSGKSDALGAPVQMQRE